MPSFKMTTQIDVAFESCAECGTVFGMNQELQDRFRKNGQEFCCPLGHRQWYGKSEADKLREQVKAKDDELLRTKRRLEWEETNAKLLQDSLGHTERRLSATKGVLTRTKNRIARGVCPCCNRTFADLFRHMAGQHPGYVGDERAEDVGAAPDAPLDPAGAPPAPTGGDLRTEDDQRGRMAEMAENAPAPDRRGRPKGSRNRE